MKQTRNLFRRTLLLSLLFCSLLSGCSSRSTEIPQNTGRTVVDMMGRQVVLPAEIRTIASTGSAARLLTYAGCADKLSGVTDMDKKNDIGMPYTVVNAGHFASLASVGAGGSKDICYEEELVKLSPDVIFSNMPLETVSSLQEKTGIPVIGLSYQGIFDESVCKAIDLVGSVMGTQEKCADVVRSMQQWKADLDRRTRDIPDEEKPSVYTGAVSFKGPHGFEGTYANYPPFTAIHAKNVADETGRDGALNIDLEQVLIWNPELIFLNPSNLYLVNEDYLENKAFYENLQAVKSGNVYAQISYNYNSTNIEIAIADAYYSGKIMFPEKFSDIDPAKKADEIFEVMLGQPFYSRLEDAGIGFGTLRIGE